MSDQIIALPTADDAWTDEVPRPSPSVLIKESEFNRAYLCHDTDIADWPATATVVGGWDERTGEPLTPITADYSNWIRPLGNNNGVATRLLDSTRWAGHAEPKYFEYDATDPEDIQTERYPNTNRPFTLKIERTYITDDGFPHIPHGWKMMMLSEDPLRDITARAIGIYSDPECTKYLYTTGAFIKDALGTFFTECPVGQRTADEVPIYFALLLGSAQEGIWNMEVGKVNDAREFWSGDM